MNVPATETKAAFARRIGRSKPYVTKLISKGLPLTDDGTLVLVKKALSWIDGNISTGNGKKNTDINTAKARLVLAQAEMAEFALQREHGRYVLREDVKHAARAFGRAHRDAMLNFANRYGASIAAKVGCNPVLLTNQIEANMRLALTETVGIPVPYNEGEEDKDE